MDALKTLVAADIVLILLSVIFFDTKVLYNTQIAFLTSTLVIVGSLFSYSRMVHKRIEHNIITEDDDRDLIDKLDDPHDLYSEEIVNDPDEDLKEAIEEEKRKQKQNRRSLFEVLKDMKAALSVYRIGAYFLLFIGFLYLNRNGLLHIPSYLIALSIPIVVIVVILMRGRSTLEQPEGYNSFQSSKKE